MITTSSEVHIAQAIHVGCVVAHDKPTEALNRMADEFDLLAQKLITDGMAMAIGGMDGSDQLGHAETLSSLARLLRQPIQPESGDSPANQPLDSDQEKPGY